MDFTSAFLYYYVILIYILNCVFGEIGLNQDHLLTQLKLPQCREQCMDKVHFLILI